MLFQINPQSQLPIWNQIVNQIKELIFTRLLLPGDKIPSVRELSSTLIVNPNTVSKAYQELERQGIIESLQGRGSFIRPVLTPKIDEKKLSFYKRKLNS